MISTSSGVIRNWIGAAAVHHHRIAPAMGLARQPASSAAAWRRLPSSFHGAAKPYRLTVDRAALRPCLRARLGPALPEAADGSGVVVLGQPLPVPVRQAWRQSRASSGASFGASPGRQQRRRRRTAARALDGCAHSHGFSAVAQMLAVRRRRIDHHAARLAVCASGLTRDGDPVARLERLRAASRWHRDTSARPFPGSTRRPCRWRP